MRNGNDYAHFLCEMSSLLKKGAKISMKSLKAFDKGFDEDKADKIWLFPFLMGELIIHHELDTFDKQIDFLTKNFERDLIHELTQYYTEDFYGIEYIKSFNDLKRLDKIAGTTLYEYFTNENIYRDIFYEYNEDKGERSIRDLKLLDIIEPEENHIPHCLIFMLKERDNDAVEEIFQKFRSFFSQKQLCKDNILKNYFTENNLTECLEQIEDNNTPTL